MFKKNISDGVGSRNESIDTPLYPPLFWLENIFKHNVLQFLFWGPFSAFLNPPTQLNPDPQHWQRTSQTCCFDFFGSGFAETFQDKKKFHA